ncbi:hypothetical protein CBS101457_002770 [Exobasidium rhododendri]|nr:hypothetical protein CBS101457_002770 [Exobasidium rhododendri]
MTSTPSSMHGSHVMAGDVAYEVNLESGNNSLRNFDLEPVDQHTKVHSSSAIVKDKKTGRHYKKVEKPVFSLARSKGAARVDHSDYHGAPIGLGHSMPNSRRTSIDESTRGGGVSVPADPNAYLLNQIRLMIREEVRTATVGHADQLRQHMDDAIEKVAAPEEQKEGANKSLKKSTETSYKVTEASSEDLTLDEEEEDFKFPNPWARIRHKLREPFAEFLACFILITFGDGINVQVTASALYDAASPKGSYLSISFGWGIGVMMAIYVAGGISGGHINPGVTLVLAIFRGFPWRKVPGYIIAQLLGAMCGALCIYGLYAVPLRIIDPDQTELTASLFTTFPATFLRGSAKLHAWTAFNEIYATAILIIVVLAIGDSGNAPPTEGMAPLVLMWLITGIGATLGWQTAYSVNPIRDWGPRIALTIVGYKGLWSFQGGYFAYTPLASSLTGALTGAFIYDLLIYTGGESWLNKPWSWNRPQAPAMSKKKMPMAID